MARNLDTPLPPSCDLMVEKVLAGDNIEDETRAWVGHGVSRLEDNRDGSVNGLTAMVGSLELGEEA